MITLTLKKNNEEILVSFDTIKKAVTYIRGEYKKTNKLFKGELLKIHSDDPSDARKIAFLLNDVQKKESEKGSKVTDSEFDVLEIQHG